MFWREPSTLNRPMGTITPSQGSSWPRACQRLANSRWGILKPTCWALLLQLAASIEISPLAQAKGMPTNTATKPPGKGNRTLP